MHMMIDREMPHLIIKVEILPQIKQLVVEMVL